MQGTAGRPPGDRGVGPYDVLRGTEHYHGYSRGRLCLADLTPP